MTAAVASFFNGVKTTLASRNAAYFWGPPALLAATVADRVFQTRFSKAVSGVLSDVYALDSITFPLVDGVREFRSGLSGDGIIHWLAALYMGSAITGVHGVARELGHVSGEGVASVCEVVDSAGATAKAMWTSMRVNEIQQTDYVKGADDSQAALARSQQKLDLARYAIWTVSAAAVVIFSTLAAQGNLIAQAAGAFAEQYSLALITNGVRGALGLAGYIIGLNLIGWVPAQDGSDKYMDIQQVDVDTWGQARSGVKSNSNLNNVFAKAQYIADNRVRTRSLTKVVRGLLLGLGGVFRAVGWGGSAEGAAAWSNWLAKRQTFCKVVSVPGWIAKGADNMRLNRRLDASALKAWLEWGFDGTYNVCAAPGYLWSKAGAQLPANVNWYLTEATRHWCALFQAAALLVEFGGNVYVPEYQGALANRARTRFANGMRNLKNGEAMSENNWRDTLYTVDRLAVVAMTVLTLYRWFCDSRGKTFASFGSLILVCDAAKAGASLAKMFWEDRDNSGFIGHQARAELLRNGIPAADDED